MIGKQGVRALAVCLLLSVFIGVHDGRTQSPFQFSTYTNALVNSSPSLVGWHGGVEVTGSFNNFMEGQMFSGSASGYVRPVRMAIGFAHNNFNINRYRNSTTDLVVSPKLKAGSEITLSPSLSLTRTISWDEYYDVGTNEYSMVFGLGILHQRYFLSYDHRFSVGDATVDYVQLFKLRGGMVLDAGEIKLLPTIGLFNYWDQLKEAFSRFQMDDWVFRGSLNIIYRNITLATGANYGEGSHYFDRALNAGVAYTFFDRIRVGYTVTTTRQSLLHEIGIRAILFSDDDKLFTRSVSLL